MDERKLVLQNPIREPQGPDKSYNGPKNSKQLNLVEENKEPRKVWIAFELAKKEKSLLIENRKSYKDIFRL